MLVVLSNIFLYVEGHLSSVGSVAPGSRAIGGFGSGFIDHMLEDLVVDL